MKGFGGFAKKLLQALVAVVVAAELDVSLVLAASCVLVRYIIFLANEGTVYIGKSPSPSRDIATPGLKRFKTSAATGEGGEAT